MNKCLVRFKKIERRMYIKTKHVWAVDKVINSPFKDIKIPDFTISEYIWRNLDQWSNRTAVVCGVTDRSYTYIQVYNQSRRFGACLKKIFHLKDGDMVAIMMPNVPEYPSIILGILAAGGVITPVNPLYTAYELQNQLSMSNAKVIVTIPEIASIVKVALELAKADIPIIIMDINGERAVKSVSYQELIESNTDLSILKDVKRTVKDVAFLSYSSGTTGLPKGIEWTNKNLISNCEQQNTELRHFNYTTETNQDTVLANLPLFHTYGLSVVLLHKMSVGLKLVTLPRFHPETFVKAFEKHRLNLLYLAPPTVLFMANHSGFTIKHLQHVMCMTVGAAPLPKSNIERFMNKANNKVHFSQAYGLTETSGAVTMSPRSFNNPFSVGLPLPNLKLRVVDREFRNLGPNELGELLIHGPNVMKGYKDNEDANKEAFVGEWFRSGDMARIDEEGAVYIADRLKELIKVNAYQVSPAELECVVKQHTDVLDAAVIGVPDSITGQRPKAFIVLKEGSKSCDTEIMDFVNMRLAPFKKIKEIEFIENIPKNPSGKILRRNLAMTV